MSQPGTATSPTPGPLAGRLVAIARADSAAGADLAAGLADLGATVVALDDLGGPAGAPAAGTRAGPAAGGEQGGPDGGAAVAPGGGAAGGAVGSRPVGGAAVAPGGGAAGPGTERGPDLVVVPVLPGVDGGRRRPLVELSPDGWAEACEAPLAAVRDGLVAARRIMGAGGTIVVVGPVAAITGEAGLVGYATAAEGARLLALSCARAWGVHDITVHWLATVTSLLAGGEPGERAVLWDPALGRPPTLRGEVAAAVAGLAAPTMRFVTGASVTVDGGVVLHT